MDIHDVEEEVRDIEVDDIELGNIDVEILLSEADDDKKKQLIRKIKKMTLTHHENEINQSDEDIVCVDNKEQVCLKVTKHNIHISNTESENKSREGIKNRIKKFKIHIDKPNHEELKEFIILGSPESEHRIEIPRFDTQSQIWDIQYRFFVVSIGIFIVVLLLATYMVHRLTRPMKSLEQATQQLGSGELGIQIDHNDRVQQKEVKQVIEAFNKMSMQLKDLQETNDRFKSNEHLSELGEVARGLAHTVRNPLNTLGLCVETLGQKSNNNQQDKHKLVQTARQQINIIDNWIRSFLIFSNGSINLNETVNIKHLCQELVLEAGHDPDKNVHIKINCTITEPFIQGSQGELRTVLQALIVNAIQASFNEGEVVITITAFESSRINIIIADQGKGISPEIKKQLFQPHITNKTQGAGMGLYLCKRILETRYDGIIEFKDNSPNGTIADVMIARQRVG